MSLLSIKGLNVAFDTPEGQVVAVDDLNLALSAGETLGIVGESGSGKSQAMLAVTGLLAKNGKATGEVVFDGQDLLGSDEALLNQVRGGQIGMVFQDPMTSLNPYLRIETQLLEVLSLHKNQTGKLARSACVAALDRVRIDQPERRLRQYPHELSGGMRQRVALAMALLCEPKLLIADEPTTALDVTVQSEILDLLREIKQQSNTAIVFISHDLAVVSRLCDRVLVMQKGKVMEQGHTNTVLKTPAKAYTQALIHAVPRLSQPAPVLTDETSERPMLSVNELKVYFSMSQSLFRKTQFKAVDDVSFEVSAGKTLGIVGESGSGKSTVAKAILGLVPVTDGSAQVNGQTITGLDGKHRRQRFQDVQVVFQDPLSSLNPRMTIGQTLAEPLKVHQPSLSPEDIRQRVVSVMEQVGLSGQEINRYPHEYSGGQCQRVGIARALMINPKVIICDEAVSALDVSIQSQVLNLLKELQQRLGLTLVFIAHDISVVKSMSHHMMVMQRGRVVESGLSETICDQPQHPYTQALLAAVPSL